MEPTVEEVKDKRKYTKKEKPLDEEQKQEIVTTKKEKKQRKKRVVDDSKMTYIKAFAIWKKQQDPPYVGLSPKRGTQEYEQIMEILRKGQ